MLFHSKYVFLTLLGLGIGWGTQQRDDQGTGFRDALRFHGGGTLLGLVWGLVLYHINRVFFWWTSPLILSLLLSIPVSMLTSRAGMGRALRRVGIFLTPEETNRPREYRDIDESMRRMGNERPALDIPLQEGFVRAAVVPGINVLHRSLLRGARSLAPGIVRRRDALVEHALRHGPDALSQREKMEILLDDKRLEHLHRGIWDLPSELLEKRWKARLD